MVSPVRHDGPFRRDRAYAVQLTQLRHEPRQVRPEQRFMMLNRSNLSRCRKKTPSIGPFNVLGVSPAPGR
jgi:hypothetical protein